MNQQHGFVGREQQLAFKENTQSRNKSELANDIVVQDCLLAAVGPHENAKET